MNSLHPASVICGWLMLLFATAASSGWLLVFHASIFSVLSSLQAGQRFLLLLKRSRWLLLAMLLTFGLMTPGAPILSGMGVTYEGLQLAGDSIARLLIALATLALVLDALPPLKLIVGIRALLAPLEIFGPAAGLRDRLAVRLALTLEMVEQLGQGRRDAGNPMTADPDAASLALPVIPFRRLDRLIGLLAGSAFAALSLRWLT